MKQIVFTVTNDLNYDQRMIRICTSLARNGYRIILVGRKNRNSLPLQQQPFQQKRLHVFFQRKFFFYCEYNFRLFFYLLFVRADAFCCIDLDTMLPVYFAGRLRKKKLVYDAHEYFSQQKEIVTRPKIYKVWNWIERNFVPRFRNGYTATQSITDEFAKKFQLNYATIRNLPLAQTGEQPLNKSQKIILYQGAINEARGFEFLIPAMQMVNAVLHIYGDGNFVPQLNKLIAVYNVESKVKFFDKLLPQQLKAITHQAYIGLNLVENTGLNQYYSLANKFFDYIQALVPQVTMDFPEYRKINERYQVALLIENLTEENIATSLNRLLDDKKLYAQLQHNCSKARAELNWENEEKIYGYFISNCLDKNLHILCPDVPWPADYGGVIDPFYLLVQLKAVGIQVYLHCFTQNRAPQKELEKYCKEVHYYRRDKTALLSNTLPYIVKSRSSKKLLQELGKNNYPILMQGIHTTYFLYKKLLPNRKILLRPFNVESTYYQQLSALEINPFKKYFFKRESRLLKSYEKEVSTMIPILALSQTDKQFFEEQNARSYFIPVIIPWQEVSILPGTGNYCLYHGNLSVNENQKAVEWLLTKVFNDLEFPIFFAGKNPNPKTAKLISKNKNAALIANPTESKMQELIKNAQINLAPSFNHTGIKLKILNALFNGRHCIANLQAVRGSGIEALVSVADDAENMKKAILELMALPVTEEQKGRRSAVLNDVYNNKKNTEKIIAMIY